MLVLWRGWELFSPLNHIGFHSCQATFNVWPDSLTLKNWMNDPFWQPARLTGREPGRVNTQYLTGGSCYGPKESHYVFIHCMLCCWKHIISTQTQQLHFVLWRQSLRCISSEQSAICSGPSAFFVQLRGKLQREEMSISSAFNTVTAGNSFQNSLLHLNNSFTGQSSFIE